MSPEKGKLYFRDPDWIIYTSGQKLKLNHDNVKDFGLKKNGHYYRCCYSFNSHNQLCIWSDELEFCLSKTCEYDILFER